MHTSTSQNIKVHLGVVDFSRIIMVIEPKTRLRESSFLFRGKGDLLGEI